MSKKEKPDIQNNLRKLEEISAWFEKQEEINLEEGLQKVKEGAEIIKATRSRLKRIKNEFEEIQKSLQD